MNTGTFYSVVDELLSDYVENDVLDGIDAVISALNVVIAQPGQNSDIGFKKAITELFSSLEGFSTNCATATQLVVLEEISAFSKSGDGLVVRIREIVSENNLTPSIVAQELSEIHDEVAEFVASLNAISKSFRQLSVEKYNLDPGEVELNIVYPDDVQKFSIEDLQKELKDLDRIVKTLAEIVGDKLDVFDISSIGSSRLTINVISTMGVAMNLATIVSLVLASYSAYLQIKVSAKQLEEMSIPKDTIAKLHSDNEEKYAKEMEKIVKSVLENHKKVNGGLDSGRLNELETATSDIVGKISDKIKKGVDFDVTAKEYVIESEGEGEESEGAEGEGAINTAFEIDRKIEQINEQIAELKETSKRIKSLKCSTHPVLPISSVKEGD